MYRVGETNSKRGEVQLVDACCHVHAPQCACADCSYWFLLPAQMSAMVLLPH